MASQQDESASNNTNNNNVTNEDVVNRIEEIINDTIQSLDNEEVPTLTWDKYNNDKSHQSSNKKSSSMRILQQSRSFTSIFMILQYVHTLLKSNRTTTTREVYYFFVTYFKNQRECDTAILDAARLLGVSRIRLGLTASPKGWYCGSVIVHTRNDNDGEMLVVDGTRPPCMIQGIPITREWIDHEITSNSNVVSILPSSEAKCILVIEKEGIYTRLSEDRFYLKFPCILVTGRGFPDVATRALVYNMYHTLEIPVIGLCDCNPFGISVLFTFISGSERLGLDQEKYTVPMHWIGLRPSHVKQLVDHTNNSQSMKLPDTVFQKLTSLDKKRIQFLSNTFTNESALVQDNFSCCMESDEEEQLTLLDELSIMSEQGYKLELEALYWLGMDYLSSWLLKKLQNCSY